MIEITQAIAAASGLRDEDRDLVKRLVNAWHKHYRRNNLRHTYYTMHNRLVDLDISIPPKLKNLSAACGWGKKCVDVMVEHSKFDGFTTFNDEAQSTLDVICRRNSMRTLYRKATTSALEQCFALYFVSKDENDRARVTAYPARVCGCTWDDAHGCLEAAMFVVSMKKSNNTADSEKQPDWVNVVTSDFLIRIKCGDGNDWYAEYEPHGLGHLPVFLTANEATLDRPFGTSRITRDVMGYIDSAVRANINEEIAAAFSASTQKYLLGTDGDPFEDVSRWNAYIGSIFNIDATEDGVIPQFGQLPQPSMEPLTAHWRNLCGKMAGATGIHVGQFGQVHDNPASSDAIYAENEPLILKVRDWNEDVSDVLSEIAIALIATEHGTTFAEVESQGLGIEARFRNPALPTLAQQTDASVKLASVKPAFADTDTFWEMNGLGKEERERVQHQIAVAETKRAAQSAVSAIFGGADNAGGEGVAQ